MEGGESGENVESVAGQQDGEEKDSNCGGGGGAIMDKDGRVSIPLSFIILFLIILVVTNICLFSYALSKAAANSAEDEDEEENEEKGAKESPPKKDPAGAGKEESVITRANNPSLMGAPSGGPRSSDDKETRESTPLLRAKGRDSRKKSVDSNTPAPIYKTDSTEFWEIEADHGYNEV